MNKINSRNYFKKYLKRVNMILTLNGDRKLVHHMKQIRKIEKNEREKEGEEEEEEKNTEIGKKKSI